MLKNLVIFTLSVVLIYFAGFAYLYQHRVEQIFITDTLNNRANEARFQIKIAERIAAGQTKDAERMLRNVAASNVQEAKDSVAKLDLGIEDLVTDAQQAAQMLDEIGVRDVSNALEERKKKVYD